MSVLALAQHIATQVLEESQSTSFPHKMSFNEFELWFEKLEMKQKTHKEVDVNGRRPGIVTFLRGFRSCRLV
jgi:hypothetical protein